jgi:hypothetical protein
MITVKFEIDSQEIPTSDLRTLLAAALMRGADETTSWKAEAAVCSAARAMRDAEITETV